MADQFGHDVFPGALDHLRVVGEEVGLGDAEVDLGIGVGLVLGDDEALGFAPVLGLQADLLVCFRVVGVVDLAAPEQPIPSHAFLRLGRLRRASPRPLASSAGVHVGRSEL